MGIINHFSEGNNDQEYNGLHSHWKDEHESKLVEIFTEDAIITSYNLAIDRCISQLESEMIYPVQDTEGNYINVGTAIKHLQSLKK